jgi:hypothetical protein
MTTEHTSQVHLAERVVELLDQDDVRGALELLAAEGDAPAQADARHQLAEFERAERIEIRRGITAALGGAS